jgi:hypothetical protein
MFSRGCFSFKAQISRRRSVAINHCGIGAWTVDRLDRWPVLASIRRGMRPSRRAGSVYSLKGVAPGEGGWRFFGAVVREALWARCHLSASVTAASAISELMGE